MKEVKTHSLAEYSARGGIGYEKHIENEYGDIIFPIRPRGFGNSSINITRTQWKYMEEMGFRGRFAVANRNWSKDRSRAHKSLFEFVDSLKEDLPTRVALRKEGQKKGEVAHAEVSLLDVSTVTRGGIEYRVITIEYPKR